MNGTLQASDDLDEAPVGSPDDFAQALRQTGATRLGHASGLGNIRLT